MVDAMKRASARSITVVAPFLGYSRQDKKHQGREPITARLMFDLFRSAGADRIMTRRPARRPGAGLLRRPGRPSRPPCRSCVDYVRNSMPLANTTIVSPDAGRIKVSEQWAAKLGGLPLAFIHKTRDTTRPNHAEAHGIIGDVEGTRLRGRRRHDRHRRHHLRGRAHAEQRRREVRDARRHPRPAVRPGRGTPARTAAHAKSSSPTPFRCPKRSACRT